MAVKFQHSVADVPVKFPHSAVVSNVLVYVAVMPSQLVYNVATYEQVDRR